MKGSEGKNLNNRMDEVLGVGEDLRQAQAHGLVPARLFRAYVFIMEASPAVLAPVRLSRGMALPADPVFHDGTYLDRMSILCERIRETGLYDLTWAIAARTDPIGFYEPNPKVGWNRFAAGLAEAFT